MSGAHACTVNSVVHANDMTRFHYLGNVMLFKCFAPGLNFFPGPTPVCKCKVTAFLSVQVETIRDAYMVVAGVPNKTTFHAHHICDMALDMLSSIDHLKDPSTGDNIQIRVGERRISDGWARKGWVATEGRSYPLTPLNWQEFRFKTTQWFLNVTGCGCVADR